MVVAVCVAIENWKLVHDVGLGTVEVGDVQLPTSDDVPAEVVPEPVTVPGLAVAGVGVGVGPSTLVVDLLNPQPIVITDAATRIATKDSDLFILQTCNGRHASVRP